MGIRNATRAKSKLRRQERVRRLQQSLAARGETLSDASEPGCLLPDEQVSHFEREETCAPAAAECGPATDETSTIKQVAAAALILGQNVLKTAAALGVDRRTVQRWSKYDPEFQAAMAATKMEVVVTSRQNLLALTEAAVEMVEKKLTTDQSPQVALALLRGMGILCPHLPIPESPDETNAENKKRAQSATFGTGETKASAPTTEDASHRTNAEQVVNNSQEICQWSDLLPDQRLAVSEIFLGKSLTEVAKVALTTEATLRNWLCHDVRFFTLLSELQLERLTRLKFRILKLTEYAINVIRQAIDADNARVALAVLRGLGLMK